MNTCSTESCAWNRNLSNQCEHWLRCGMRCEPAVHAELYCL
ncbi:MAG: hypothetical protein KAT43_05990 [Nanoarchaeota archaeon]|nr:hypothetical protein [Nanoarchaeota archaeon]